MGLFNHFIDRLTHPQIQTEQLAQRANNDHFVDCFANYQPLMALQDKRQLLEVCVSGHKNSFQSMIIGIDFTNGSFSLDEFSPSLLSPDALVNETITIKHHRDWEKLEIQTTIFDWSHESHCYHLVLPELVDYQPRRNYPRLLLENSNPLKSHINPLYGAPWYATVKDISHGGMRVNVSGDIRPHLQKDTVLPKCQVLLDNDINIQCQGLVKGFRYVSRPSRSTEIGIEFQQMSPRYQTDLERFLEFIEVAA